jgi:RHS repeat-associated protein
LIELGGTRRFLLIGGEGSGQVFDCASPTCRPQRGYHGKLVETTNGVVFTARSGTEYRYLRADTRELSPRFWLTEIVDPRGNETWLEYGGPEVDGELVRVFEPGNKRLLQLEYEWPGSAAHPQLAKVSLLSNPSGKRTSDQLAPIDDPGICVAYTYDPYQNLASASRYDGPCTDGAEPLRTEKYGYAGGTNEAIRNNLVSYTDPNGRTTGYAYLTRDAVVAGESQYLLMGDREERVHEVREPAPGGVTTFEYSLVPKQVALFGETRPLYETRVVGARSGSAPTTYRLDGYGASAQVTRGKSVRTTLWDRVHIRPVEETDPRGRKVSMRYDANGNLIERRTSTRKLEDPSGAPATEPLLDADGVEVAELVERWAFDPGYGGEICHVDAEGRLTTTRYVLGLSVERREHATALDSVAVAQAATTCEALASGASTSSKDRVTRFTYCDVQGGACGATAGARRGDLVETTDGPRLAAAGSYGIRRVAVTAYDAYGLAERTRTELGDGGYVEATTRHDSRGRLTSETDSLGHALVRRFDGLDRVASIHRVNTRGGSPGEYRTWGYYPGGQLLSETVGRPQDPSAVRARSIVLDGLNLPEKITDSIASGDSTQTVVAITRHDAAGNVYETVDRRGVRRVTAFDSLDRATSVQVFVDDEAAFGGAGGDLTGFVQGKQIASFSYDAAGNKISETDLHGHRTELRLDPLYRVVGVVAPVVPKGLVGSGAGTVRYEVRRRFDRVGNKVQETDGNGHVTTWTYDFANRAVDTVDPVGRFERRAYDGLGEVVEEVAGVRSASGAETVHLTRTSKGYDGLGRPRGMTERFADLTGERTVETDVAYDDADRAITEWDRRGAVTRRRLDDLDRPYEETVDVATGRRGEVVAFPALALTTRYEYDAGGKRAAAVDPLGRRTEEVFDGLGRLVERKLPMGVTETARYDGEGNATSRTDGRGVETRYRYDPLGRETRRLLVESISNGGTELALVTRQFLDAADGDGLVRTIESDALGHPTTRALDALHREVKTVDAAGAIVLTAYDATQRRAVRDRRGFVTEYDQDGARRPVAQRELRLDGAPAFAQSWAYDDAARVETWTDRRGMPTVTTRDGAARVRKVVRGEGDLEATETTAYDGNGNVVRVVDPNGHATESAYDGANRKRSETRGAGTAVAATWTFRYDGAGNRTEMKGPRGTWAFDVRETHDDLDRAVRSEVPTGDPAHPYAVTSRAFDAAGNKLCEKRPLGGDPLGAAAAAKTVAAIASAVCAGDQVTRYAYDELSKLTSVVDANGGEHSFVYDAARNLVAKQDANGNLTTYGHDRLNRRTDEWQHLDLHARVRSRGAVPDAAAEGPADPKAETGALHWHVKLDANGNVTERTDPRGVTVASTYGVLDRLEAVTYPQPGLRIAYPYPVSTAYRYDGNGNVEKVTERKQASADATVEEVTDPEYDGLGRLASEQRYDGKTIRYGYDAKGNRKKVTDPDGVATEYGYDAQDRLETATTPAGMATYRYWADGLLKGTSLSNGLEEARCYDPAGRVTAIVTARGAIGETCPDVAGMVSRFDYRYDANGNRSLQWERRTAPGSSSIGAIEETRYGYDALDRLVGVGYPDRTVLYQLDAVGNRVGERVKPAAGVLALTVAAFTALTPADGLASDLVSTFNRADWLVAQSDAVDATRNATYAYDKAGNLTDKVKGGVVRQLRWSYRDTLSAVLQGADAGQLVEVGRYDYDADLQRVKRTTSQEQVEYVLDERHVLQEATGAAGHPAYRRYHFGTGPLLVEDGTNRHFINTDALGSTTDLTGAGASVASMRKYDAWGQYRNDTAPLPGEPKLGFTGHQYDPETGLVYARARYYDADLGRFLSRDSLEGEIGDAPSLHRYMYVRSNPLRYTDPDGLREMTAEEAGRDAEWAAAYAQANATWEAMPWYRKVADFFDSGGSRQTSRILARNINAYRTGIAQAADGEAVAQIDVAAEYGEGPGTVKLPSGEQELSRGPLVVPASKVAGVQAQRRLNREALDAVTAGPAASTAYAIADAAGASAETKASVAKTVALAESTAYVAAAFAPGNATAELKANIARDGQMVTGATAAPRRQSVGAAAVDDPALGVAPPKVSRAGSSLDPSISRNFVEAERIVLTEPTTFTRFHGGTSQKVRRWMTSEELTSRVDVRRRLALPQEWGNRISKITEVTLPEGTVIWRGPAAPQVQANGKVLPGGGDQVYVEGPLDPTWFGETHHFR